jgi:hypothetical protein
MKFEPSGSYEKMDQRTLEGGTAVAWISREAEDLCWDKFLQETPLGQFQQSTMWARAKHSEGWKPVRVVVTMEEEIVAGFQILWQSLWHVRMGYVSKGPVVWPGHHGLAEYATALLQKLSREERLRALVVQPPDLCVQMSEALACNGFMQDMSAKVIDATWILDLGDGFDAVEQRMRTEKRRVARQAVKLGVSIREGDRRDLGTFFELMLSTCRRQGVKPNPRDVSSLLALWDAAEPGGCILLFFAEYEAKPLAGLLCIPFGNRFTLWKKGWSSTEGHRHPNDLAHYEALKWACLSGYRFGDFAAFDKQMAVAILSGKELSPEQERTRHIFNAHFGGRPRLLPAARVYFPNPLIRTAYRVFFHKKLRQAEEECKLGRGF